MLGALECYGKTVKAEGLGPVSTLDLQMCVNFLTVDLLKFRFLLKVVLSLVGVMVMDPRAFRMLANYRCMNSTLCLLTACRMNLARPLTILLRCLCALAMPFLVDHFLGALISCSVSV